MPSRFVGLLALLGHRLQPRDGRGVPVDVLPLLLEIMLILIRHLYNATPRSLSRKRRTSAGNALSKLRGGRADGLRRTTVPSPSGARFGDAMPASARRRASSAFAAATSHAAVVAASMRTLAASPIPCRIRPATSDALVVDDDCDADALHLRVVDVGVDEGEPLVLPCQAQLGIEEAHAVVAGISSFTLLLQETLL